MLGEFQGLGDLDVGHRFKDAHQDDFAIKFVHGVDDGMCLLTLFLTDGLVLHR